MQGTCDEGLSGSSRCGDQNGASRFDMFDRGFLKAVERESSILHTCPSLVLSFLPRGTLPKQDEPRDVAAGLSRYHVASVAPSPSGEAKHAE